MSENEATTYEQKPIIEELKSYGNHVTLYCIDRDGDLFYVECPNCQETNIRKRTIFGCPHCFTQFNMYTEDGVRRFSVITQLGSMHGYGEKIKILKLKKNDYFWNPLYGRNDNQVEEIKKQRPEVEFKTLARDLTKGMDAHGHQRYKRFAIIPLD